MTRHITFSAEEVIRAVGARVGELQRRFQQELETRMTTETAERLIGEVRADLDAIRRSLDEAVAANNHDADFDSLEQRLATLRQHVDANLESMLKAADAEEHFTAFQGDLDALKDGFDAQFRAIGETESEAVAGITERMADMQKCMDEQAGRYWTAADADKFAECMMQDLVAIRSEFKAQIEEQVAETFEEQAEDKLSDWREMRIKAEQFLLELDRRRETVLDEVRRSIEAFKAIPPAKDGDRGETGEQGPTGEKGETGDKGEKGERGETGERGADGVPGEKGERGETGERGADGLSMRFLGLWQKGNEYRRGDFVTKDGSLWSAMKTTMDEPGESGDFRLCVMRGKQGAKGDKGESGAQGVTGPRGEKGSIGPRGPKIIELRFTRHNVLAIDEEGNEIVTDASEMIVGIRDAVVDLLRTKGFDV